MQLLDGFFIAPRPVEAVAETPIAEPRERIEKLGATSRDKIFDQLADDLGMDKDSLSNRYYALLHKLR